MSTSCPGCHKPVIVEDIVVKSYKPVFNVETCGKLIVRRNGRVLAQKRVVAHEGIEVEGFLQCKEAESSGLVQIGPKAEWQGDLRSPVLSVEAGAKIRGGHFRIPDDPLADAKREDKEKGGKDPP